MSGEEAVSWGITLLRTVVERTTRVRMRVGDFMLVGVWVCLCGCLEFEETELLYIWWEVNEEV